MCLGILVWSMARRDGGPRQRHGYNLLGQNSQNWGGYDADMEMSDTELLNLILQRKSENVSVLGVDSCLSDYLTEERFDQEVAFLDEVAATAHENELKAVIYYPALEVLTADGEDIENTMYKDHPDWVQYGIDVNPNVFYGSQEHWAEPGTESA